MKITHLPENGKNFIPYDVTGDVVDFNDGELMINLAKKERDYEVTIDICQDYTGGLVVGTGNGKRYVAQAVIPAREYTETDIPNPDYDPEAEDSTASPTIKNREPVPFDIDKCELRLWEMEA